MNKSGALTLAILFGVGLSSAVMAAERGREASKQEQEKILEALSGLGCTEIKGETEDEGTHFEVDDIVCQGRSYDIQIDKDMKIITMVRDPGP